MIVLSVMKLFIFDSAGNRSKAGTNGTAQGKNHFHCTIISDLVYKEHLASHPLQYEGEDRKLWMHACQGIPE